MAGKEISVRDVGFDVGRLASVGLEIDVERGDSAKSWPKRRRAGRLPLGGEGRAGEPPQEIHRLACHLKYHKTNDMIESKGGLHAQGSLRHRP